MDLKDLYRDVILDHNKHPRNFGRLEPCDSSADGHNPLCGDQLTVYLQVEDGVVREASFVGHGCAISTASASLMTEALKGKPINEIEHLFEAFHNVVTTDCECPKGLGKLGVLAGVRDYPSRVKCATLAWHAVRAALEKRRESVATE